MKPATSIKDSYPCITAAAFIVHVIDKRTLAAVFKENFYKAETADTFFLRMPSNSTKILFGILSIGY